MYSRDRHDHRLRRPGHRFGHRHRRSMSHLSHHGIRPRHRLIRHGDSVRALIRDAVGGLALQMAFCLVTYALLPLLPVADNNDPRLTNDILIPTAWNLVLTLVRGFAGGLANHATQEPAPSSPGKAWQPRSCRRHMAADLAWQPTTASFFLSAVRISASTSYSSRSPHGRAAASASAASEAGPQRRRRDQRGRGRRAYRRSHSLRWRILLGTGLFAIPRLLLHRQS